MPVDLSSERSRILKAIAEWIEQDGDLETANRSAWAIYDSVQSPRTMPYPGPLRPAGESRELVVACLPYLVVYQVFAERLVILNVLYGAQRWP